MKRDYGIELWLACAAALLLHAVAAHGAEKPGGGYALREQHTAVSPDGKLRVEQYAKVDDGGDWSWQFWVFDQDRTHSCLLNDEPMPFYAADFYFTHDTRWLVREQKIGSGNFVLYLYKREWTDYTEVTKTAFSDMAWDYFNSVRERLNLTAPDDHPAAHMVKGLEENYRALGIKWPESRYLAIVLTGHHMEDFLCVYDLKTGKFSRPPELLVAKKLATNH